MNIDWLQFHSVYQHNLIDKHIDMCLNLEHKRHCLNKGSMNMYRLKSNNFDQLHLVNTHNDNHTNCQLHMYHKHRVMVNINRLMFHNEYRYNLDNNRKHNY